MGRQGNCGKSYKSSTTMRHGQCHEKDFERWAKDWRLSRESPEERGYFILREPNAPRRQCTYSQIVSILHPKVSGNHALLFKPIIPQFRPFAPVNWTTATPPSCFQCPLPTAAQSTDWWCYSFCHKEMINTYRKLLTALPSLCMTVTTTHTQAPKISMDNQPSSSVFSLPHASPYSAYKPILRLSKHWTAHFVHFYLPFSCFHVFPHCSSYLVHDNAM